MTSLPPHSGDSPHRTKYTHSHSPLGIRIATDPIQIAQTIESIRQWLSHYELQDFVVISPLQPDGAVNEINSASRATVQARLSDQAFAKWTPEFDTLRLATTIREFYGPNVSDPLEKETLLAMLACPIGFDYPSVEESESSFRIRVNIARAASKTFLSFDAYGAERPDDYWHYDEEKGFLIKQGMPLIEALRLATQPGESGTVYSFSCYRATEYVVALGIAQEAHRVNPKLMRRLQTQAERRAIRSGEFHEVFMKEYGSREKPLPPKYYVAGDRVWFKNPDPESANALGFEGSWLFYIGNGLFSDFWKRDKAFTLELKCLEIYHWRDSTYQDEQGVHWMDEQRVQQHMRQTEQSPEKIAEIMSKMQRIQDGRGVYADGGCIDPSREYTRWVRPKSCDIQLSDAPELD
jgi:hypothetical protein